MGLIKSISREETRIKFPFEKAYFLISNLRQENGKIIVKVKGFADEVARRNASAGALNGQVAPHEIENNPCILEKEFSFPESALPVPTKQGIPVKDLLKHCAYLWLKQNGFADASDKFEEGQ